MQSNDIRDFYGISLKRKCGRLILTPTTREAFDQESTPVVRIARDMNRRFKAPSDSPQPLGHVHATWLKYARARRCDGCGR